MSTHAYISVVHKDNTVSTIYLHFDGYESWCGEMLRNHYNTLEKAEAVVALGDLSILDASLECPPGHKFGKRVDGHSIAYHRDRHEPWHKVKPENFKREYLQVKGQYHYIFEDGHWKRM